MNRDQFERKRGQYQAQRPVRHAPAQNPVAVTEAVARPPRQAGKRRSAERQAQPATGAGGMGKTS